MQTPVVMQKARHTLGSCEASGKVVGDKIFEGESGVILSDFSKWLELEEPKYFALLVDVRKEPPQFTRNQGWRPLSSLACENQYQPKEPEPLAEFTHRDQTVPGRNARILEAALEKDIEETPKGLPLYLTHWELTSATSLPRSHPNHN
jgi:hypothetical protein